jgi:acetyl-CoA C-acetyltransferase
MKNKVAIVGYAQSRHQYDMPKTREDMVFEVCKGAIKNAGITRSDVGAVVNCSTDFLDGRTISSMFLCMAVGAHLKDESKVEEDGAMAMQYAMMKILSQSCDVALVEAHTQGWTFNPHQMWAHTLDPLLDQQVGVMNDVAAAALQADMYMDACGVSEEHLALVSVKNLANAGSNTYAHRRMPDVSIDEVLDSKVYYSPITELMMSPVSDGAAALILASEEVAREICKDPVWIQGLGSCADGYLRDRDLTSMGSLKKAADAAYEMAGITDPFNELDVVEISERYAHEELMAYEALGLCREGKGGALIENGVTDVDGELPVNASGGALGADPVCATGLVRVIEAAKLIRGDDNYSNASGINRALAHGQFGICAQKNIVYILGSEA